MVTCNSLGKAGYLSSLNYQSSLGICHVCCDSEIALDNSWASCLSNGREFENTNLKSQCQQKSTCLTFCEKVDPESIDLLRAKVDWSWFGSMYQESMDQDPVYVPSTEVPPGQHLIFHD